MVHLDPYRECEGCGEREALLGMYCPTCGVKQLCAECIVRHIAEIAEQAGRPLGP